MYESLSVRREGGVILRIVLKIKTYFQKTARTFGSRIVLICQINLKLPNGFAAYSGRDYRIYVGQRLEQVPREEESSFAQAILSSLPGDYYKQQNRVHENNEQVVGGASPVVRVFRQIKKRDKN